MLIQLLKKKSLRIEFFSLMRDFNVCNMHSFVDMIKRGKSQNIALRSRVG